MISRFLITLRRVGSRTQTADTIPASTDIGSFAIRSTIIGNLGQPLEYGLNDDDEDMDNIPDHLIDPRDTLD